MLNSLHMENFTVFAKADLTFGKQLNVFIGENGTGKSHILKAAYSAIAVSAERMSNGGTSIPSSTKYQTLMADKLQAVFRPDGLGRLVRRQLGRHKCQLHFQFNDRALDAAFSFSTMDTDEVKMEIVPKDRVEKLPIFLPTRELLTIYPGFVSLYETTHLSFEETWRDTCILLGAPLARGPRESNIKEMLAPLEEMMGGKVELDKAGRFYLNTPTGSFEMHLVAEGFCKLAMVARLIATGSLLDKGYLFWDEPEANLNPKIIKLIARVIVSLCKHGIQVFVATHSLFLLRELYILQQSEFAGLDARYFGLQLKKNGVAIAQGTSIDDIGDITSLDEELMQSDRYMEIESSGKEIDDD